ncbi:MAG: acetyl-CoA carboxylase biotin carboxyl carrier protein [Alicyclobacillaceae bacterium]|nr:acetyl-CoA carboxylase biotin carboxyl carrier protein [Alicyclobacillaceae bacterium]
MFRVTEIRELIRLMDETSVVELEVESEGSRLSIRKAQGVAPVAVVQPTPASIEQPVAATPAAPAQQAPVSAPQADAQPAAPPKPAQAEGKTASSSAEADAKFHTITSPMVGTFYRAPAPDAEPYVQIGSRVTEKTVVCIVEAMKLMNEIEADCRGEIVEILAENGQLVEFGQPLFRVRLD